MSLRLRKKALAKSRGIDDGLALEDDLHPAAGDASIEALAARAATVALELLEEESRQQAAAEKKKAKKKKKKKSKKSAGA